MCSWQYLRGLFLYIALILNRKTVKWVEEEASARKLRKLRISKCSELLLMSYKRDSFLKVALGPNCICCTKSSTVFGVQTNLLKQYGSLFLKGLTFSLHTFWQRHELNILEARFPIVLVLLFKEITFSLP